MAGLCAVRTIHAVARVQTGAGEPRTRTSATRAVLNVAAAAPRSTAASAFRATVRSATVLGARARYGGGGRAVLHSVASQPRAPRGCRLCVVTVVANQEPVNVLMIGSGGREHALSWKLVQSARCAKLYFAPGNPGADDAKITRVLPTQLDVDDHAAVTAFCEAKEIGLVVIGPEAPLVAGLADSLRAAGRRVFGPSAAAAALEGSKKFMKDICAKYGVDTAAYASFTDADQAKAYIKQQGAPIVVKADGLAAGKGVIVAMTEQEALDAVDDMISGGIFGAAGATVVIEEFMDGEEASFFALVDGTTAVPLASAQDHKAVGEGDTGPNTGGMGAYTPAPVVPPEMEQTIMRDVILPTVKGMAAEGCPFQGVLFAGIMIQNGKPRLLEYNVRFGDPECQTLMMRLQSDLLPLLEAAADGTLADAAAPTWSNETALLVVYATEGYPGSYAKGSVISNLDAANSKENTMVFHAGTELNGEGQVTAVGGRVLGVTATGADVKAAAAAAYAALDVIEWPQGFCRRDIGWRAIARLDA